MNLQKEFIQAFELMSRPGFRVCSCGFGLFGFRFGSWVWGWRAWDLWMGVGCLGFRAWV